MTFLAPASPAYGSGQVAAVTTASAQFTLANPTKQVIFTNLGANPAYVRMTPTVAAATTADAVIPPGSMVAYTKDEKVLAITLISTGGSTNVHVMPVEGF